MVEIATPALKCFKAYYSGRIGIVEEDDMQGELMAVSLVTFDHY